MNQIKEILICTFCFLLYMPNLFIKNFTKNKWRNLLMFSILFGISIFLLDLLFNLLFKRINRIQEGAQTGSPDGTQVTDRQYYADEVRDHLNNVFPNIQRTLPPTIRPLSATERGIFSNAGSVYSAAQNQILIDIRDIPQIYVNQVRGGMTWTEPPNAPPKIYLQNFEKLLDASLNTVTVPPSVLPLYSTRAPVTTTPRPTTPRPTTRRVNAAANANRGAAAAAAVTTITTPRRTTPRPTTPRPTTPRPTTRTP